MGPTITAIPAVPAMTDLIHFALPEPYGQLTVVERLDLGTGVARFDIRGRRCAGAFLFVPETDLERAVPVKVRIRYGAQTGPSLLRIDFPTFNGVCLEGGTVLTPATIGESGSLRWRLNLRRPETNWYQHTQFPDAASDYATAVITALLKHWLSHPAHDELLLAAARHDAADRIKRITEKSIHPAHKQIAQLTAAIDHATLIIEELRQLSSA